MHMPILHVVDPRRIPVTKIWSMFGLLEGNDHLGLLQILFLHLQRIASNSTHSNAERSERGQCSQANRPHIVDAFFDGQAA